MDIATTSKPVGTAAPPLTMTKKSRHCSGQYTPPASNRKSAGELSTNGLGGTGAAVGNVHDIPTTVGMTLD
jgi:hypothetical protein